MKKIDPARCVVYFDFDNTIAACDVLDDIITRFSRNRRWVNIEKKWKQGDIGSRECLEGQLKEVNLAGEKLDQYLKGVRIDPYYKKMNQLFNEHKIKTVILSDSFDYLLKNILENNSAPAERIYCNSLKQHKNKWVLGFPFTNKRCRICAHCKRDSLLAFSNGATTRIYIGDGLSDVCPSRYAHLVFAKDDLLRYYKQHNLECVPFKKLKDVYKHLKRLI